MVIDIYHRCQVEAQDSTEQELGMQATPILTFLRESRERFCSCLDIDLALPPLFLLAKHPSHLQPSTDPTSPFPLRTLLSTFHSIALQFHLSSPTHPPPNIPPPPIFSPPHPRTSPFSTNPFLPPIRTAHALNPDPARCPTSPPPMTPCSHYPATARQSLLPRPCSRYTARPPWHTCETTKSMRSSISRWGFQRDGRKCSHAEGGVT